MKRTDFECSPLNCLGDNGPFLVFGIVQCSENGVKSSISSYVVMVNISEKTINVPKKLLESFKSPDTQDRLRKAAAAAISKAGYVPKDFKFSW